MNKMVQRVIALVVMVAVTMGAVVWGTSSMTVSYQDVKSDAPVVMTVNGDEVRADEYAGYMLYNMMYYSNMYAQLGITDLWSDPDAAATLGPAMPSAAQDQAVYTRVVLEHFNDLGLKLSYEQEQELNEVREQSIELAGHDAYVQQLAQFGFTETTYDNMMYISMCYQALNDYYFGEGGVSAPSDEELLQYFKDNYLSAKHILICLNDPTTGEALRTDEEARALAQELLDRINAGEDFDTLMNEYSEDTGLPGNPDGYIFTEGDMVDEFYEGAKALAEGEVSGLVKSDYGYHIIKREPLDCEGQLENYRSLLTTMVAGTMDDMLTEWMEEADVQTTEACGEITYENVREYLAPEVQETLAVIDEQEAALEQAQANSEEAEAAADADAEQAAADDAAADAAAGQEAADTDATAETAQ